MAKHSGRTGEDPNSVDSSDPQAADCTCHIKAVDAAPMSFITPADAISAGTTGQEWPAEDEPSR